MYHCIYPLLGEADEDEFLFQLNETREEEGRLAHTALEQLYSPYEGTVTNPSHIMHPLIPPPSHATPTHLLTLKQYFQSCRDEVFVGRCTSSVGKALFLLHT